VKHGEGNTNFPELSLVKFLLLTYHHTISGPPPWISHNGLLGGRTLFFYSWAVFGLGNVTQSKMTAHDHLCMHIAVVSTYYPNTMKPPYIVLSIKIQYHPALCATTRCYATDLSS